MNIYKKITILVASILMTGILGAQSISDLGTVWEKTYPIDGSPIGMKVTKDNKRYVVAGRNGTSGTIMIITESGELVKSITTPVTTISTSTGKPTYTPISPYATAGFYVAFETNDGGILAFGTIWDQGAASSDKSVNWTGVADNSTNGDLKRGAWLVKYNKDFVIEKAERLDGTSIKYGWQLTNDNFFVSGVDVPDAMSGTGIYVGLTLLRIYDQNGNLVTNNRSSYNPVSSMLQYPNKTDEFLLTSNNRIFDAKVVSNNITVSNNKGLGELSLTGVKVPYLFGASVAEDGGRFLSTRLNSNTDGTITYNGGAGFYKVNSSYIQEYYDLAIPMTKVYYPPYYLGGTTYVGSLSENSVSYMYQLIDDGTFNVTRGNLPTGVAINRTSVSDGFFAIGAQGGKQKIAKLSTCVNFKTTSLTSPSVVDIFKKAYNSSINFTLPLNYQGNKGTMTYDLQAVVLSGTVDGAYASDATGGVLYNKTAQTPESTTLATTINDSWQLNTKYAIIEYRLTLRDAYKTAGIDQFCGQTYIFRVVIAPQTDVVAMPIRVNDGTQNLIKTSIKNIGEGSFENYKITIYDSILGSTTQYTYTVSGPIGPNETSRLEIDLTGTPVASSTSLVVSFNDNGTGTQNQTEQSTKQFAYTIN